MAEITAKNGQKKFVSYNVAANIHQVQQGNLDAIKDMEPEKQAKYKKLAKAVIKIDFEKIEEKPLHPVIKNENS